MPELVTVDPGAGTAQVGGRTVVITPIAGGGLRVGDGPRLRPLTFAERTIAVMQSLYANDRPHRLALNILSLAAINETAEHEHSPYSDAAAIALWLAGAGAGNRAFDQTLAEAARRLGLPADEVSSMEARAVDHLAALSVGRSSGRWTKLIFTQPEQIDVKDVVTQLEETLLARASPVEVLADDSKSDQNSSGPTKMTPLGAVLSQSPGLDWLLRAPARNPATLSGEASELHPGSLFGSSESAGRRPRPPIADSPAPSEFSVARWDSPAGELTRSTGVDSRSSRDLSQHNTVDFDPGPVHSTGSQRSNSADPPQAHPLIVRRQGSTDGTAELKGTSSIQFPRPAQYAARQMTGSVDAGADPALFETTVGGHSTHVTAEVSGKSSFASADAIVGYHMRGLRAEVSDDNVRHMPANQYPHGRIDLEDLADDLARMLQDEADLRGLDP